MEFNSTSLTWRIVIAMLLAIVTGISVFYLQKIALADTSAWQSFNHLIVEGVVDIGADIFVNSLKVLVVPLVLVSLVCGVTALNSASSVGVMSVKTLGLYLVSTCLAITFALLAAHLLLPDYQLGELQTTQYSPKESPGLKAVIVDLFPKNIINVMAEQKMLPLIIFAILFGLSINRAGAAAEPVKSWFMALDKIIMQFVLLIMQLAPYGVFCLLFRLFAETGFDKITQLAAYFGVVVLVLVGHVVLTMSGLLTLFTGLKPWVLLSKLRALWMFAFSTASSNASIPVTLNTVTQRLGVNERVAAFTVPLGATINMDGTAIMQGVATVFIANVYGVDIGLVGYLTVIATATLASVGTAGVPGVGMITLATVLTQAGLPVEGIGLIIGVDRLLDMIRTAVNITGDAIVSTIVAKSEQGLDESVYYS